MHQAQQAAARQSNSRGGPATFDQDASPAMQEDQMMVQQMSQQLQRQFNELPENCSNARYLDIQAKKLMGSGSFGKTSISCYKMIASSWERPLSMCHFLGSRLTALFAFSQVMCLRPLTLTRVNLWLSKGRARVASTFPASLRSLTASVAAKMSSSYSISTIRRTRRAKLCKILSSNSVNRT